MTPTTTPTIPTIPETEQLAIRKSAQIGAAKAIQLASSVTITDSASYADADVVLFQLRSARTGIESIIEDRIGFIIKPIRAGLDALYEIRRKLTADLLAPVESAEKSVKGKMAEWQRVEKERVRREQEERAEEQRRLEAEARKREQEASQAASARERARLSLAAETARQQAAEVKSTPVSAPVKVAGSSARFVKRAEVVDLPALLRAIVKGDVPEIVVMVNQDVLDAYFEQDRGVVSTWAGVKIVEDVQIAGKRGKA